MTEVKIKKRENFIESVECIGHTGYAREGEDIVCASLSSIVQTAVLGVLSVAKHNAEFERDEERGYLKLTLNTKNVNSTSFHDAQIILNTMLCGICDLREGYSNYISLEVK